jgi:membrane protease YdiL (CAAX protease family)
VPGLLDLVLVALIVIVAPIDANKERLRLLRAIAAGEADARLRAYRRIIAWQWISATVLVALWVIMQRDFALLGINALDGRWFYISAGIALGITALLLAQLRATLTRPEAAAQVRKAAAPLQYLLPATREELRSFTLLGVTAGIVEELIYRGYLMWCIGAFAPTWMALVLSSLAFGLGHLYQGVAGLGKTAAVGLVVGGLYLLSGSIWIPMFVHAAIDVINGKMAHSALHSASEPQPNAASQVDR